MRGCHGYLGIDSKCKIGLNLMAELLKLCNKYSHT